MWIYWMLVIFQLVTARWQVNLVNHHIYFNTAYMQTATLQALNGTAAVSNDIFQAHDVCQSWLCLSCGIAVQGIQN